MCWKAFADICCPLRHAAISDSRWPPVCRPDERVTDNTVCSKVLDFPLVVGRFSFKGGLCSISSSCSCFGGRYANIQSRAASGDRNGRISAGLDVPSVRPRGSSDSWICELQTSKRRVCTRKVVSRGFSSAASLSIFKLRDVPHRRHPPSPVQLRLPCFCTRWPQSRAARGQPCVRDVCVGIILHDSCPSQVFSDLSQTCQCQHHHGRS